MKSGTTAVASKARPKPGLTPRVSVILAVHNGEPFLSEALGSLADQSYEDWECIAVDDGSTDRSGETLRQWAARDRRFSVVVNPRNLGLAASLNVALKRARGYYLARMDADDVCLAHRLRRQVELLDAHPDVTVLGSAALYIDASGAPLREVRMPERHEQIVAALPRLNPLIHPSVMMRRDALERAGGYDARQRYAQDLELWARGASLGWRFHNLQERLLLFRSQPESHYTHTWFVLVLRMRNGLKYGYPLRGLYWALAGALSNALWRLAGKRSMADLGQESGPRTGRKPS